MKFIKGLIRWVIAVTFTAIFISLGLIVVSEAYNFVPNPRNVWLAILASGTLIWWTLPRVRPWWRWRWQRGFPIKPFLSALTIAIISGATDVLADTIHAGVLTPPPVTPMVQNPFAPTGVETWINIGIIVVVGLVCVCLINHYFFRGCSDQPQKS